MSAPIFRNGSCIRPRVLGEDLLIIQKEFYGFADTRERLDLLALDKEGRLVVVENKLDDSGRDVVWQALKYVAFCSSLKKAWYTRTLRYKNARMTGSRGIRITDVQDQGVRAFREAGITGGRALCEAVRRAREGLVDAGLGGGVIKQRVARKGGGRSGGFRTIVLFRRGELAFFVYGFAKSDRANLRRDELATFRLLAGE